MTKEELEKEAEDYADKHAFRVPYDGSNKFYDDVDYKASVEGYLAGAKSREKRIAELEEKNKSLTEQVCNVANNLLDNWCRNEEDYCPHLAKLEKENAELKDDNKVMADNYSKMEQKFYDNLTKAKELLNEFMRISKVSDEDFEHDYSELIAEAEQFLKGDGCPDCFCEDCPKEDCGIKKLGLVEVKK